MGATSFVETPSKEPVSNLASIITVTGGSIIATGQDASSAYLQDSGSVTLNGVRLESASAAITSNLKQAEQTQDITVGAGSNLTVNNGTLLQVNRSDVAMDGIVNLTLKANSVAAGDIVDLDGLVPGGSETRSKGGKTNFNLESGAKWTGLVRGINDVTAGDGGTFVDEGGAPISGNVIGGTNSTVTFTNGSTISGNVQTATGSNATFNGPSSIGGNVAGTGSNYTFGDTANIGGNVTGTGSVFGFSGPTTIGGNVNGSNTSFNFSPTAQTTINGDVLLTDGSTTHGGSIQTPVSISGDVAVQNSTLGGNLNVGGTVSSQGGIFNPGNSVGTQTFESVGTLTDTEYRAEINAAGQSDKIVINTGNIDIGDVKLTVAQENGNGGYLINHDYTILQTKAGVVENEFRDPTLAANFGDLLKLNVKYDNPAEVRVGLSVDDDAIATERAGWSDNQNATYDGLMSASAGNTLATAALMDPDVKNALNQLSGEVHASTQTALMNSSGVVARTLSNRMRSNLGAGMVAGAPTAQAYGATAGSMPRSAAYPLWAEVVGNWSSLDGNNNTAKTKTDIGGLFIGGDAAVGSSGWRLGGALGFTDGKIKTDDRNSRSDVTSYTAALYGGNSWETAKGKVNFLAGAAYTRHDVDSRRSVTVGGNQTLKASYDVNTTQLFTELGYALPVGAASTIEPYVGLAWLSQDAKSFKESGGSAALSGKSQKDDITTFTLGLRGKTTVDVGANQASLMAGLGWRHAAGDVDATRTMSFIQGNGAGFKVAGAPIAKNAAVLDLAAEMGVGRNAAMGLSYAGQFGDGNTDSAGTVYLKVKF
jgi:outer membrane autotransporter protein